MQVNGGATVTVKLTEKLTVATAPAATTDEVQTHDESVGLVV